MFKQICHGQGSHTGVPHQRWSFGCWPPWMGFHRCSKEFQRRLDPIWPAFQWVQYLESHGIVVQLGRFAEFWNVWEIGGWKQCAVLPKMIKNWLPFHSCTLQDDFWKPIHPWLWRNCWYFLWFLCLCPQRVPKWLEMVLDYDLSHRNRRSCFFSPISQHIESVHPSISWTCNLCTAQNAVQEMASDSYGRLGVVSC